MMGETGEPTISETGARRKGVVPDGASAARLDQAAAALFEDLSRSRIKALILEGHARLDGNEARDPAAKVTPGQEIALEVPPVVDAAPQPQAMDLAVVYEDADVIVVDKPAGLVVHPGAGNPEKTLVNALIAHCGDSLSGIGGVKRPGIVHRLDKDTSGLLIAAKNDAAHAGLAAQFAEHSVERVYRAAVWGVPSPKEGTIAGNIGRSSRNRKKMAVVRDDRGKAAVTHYTVLRRFGRGAALVACRLETGRTHQIRVHLSHAGHPVIGDPAYSRARRHKPPIARQALHAGILGFRHPTSGETLRFESELPNDFKALLGWLEDNEKVISEY